MSALKAQTDVTHPPTAARSSAASGEARHLAEPGRVRACCGRDRARPVRVDHAVAAVSRLQRAVALLAADADPDLRDLRLRGAGQPAARRGRLRRRRPPAGAARRARRADRRNGPVPARRLAGLAVRSARRSRASPPGRRSAPPARRCWTCIRAATRPASGLTNGAAATAGIGLGILVSSSLVRIGWEPRVLPYAVLLVLAAIAFAGAYWMPEPVLERSGFRLTVQRPKVPVGGPPPVRARRLGRALLLVDRRAVLLARPPARPAPVPLHQRDRLRDRDRWRSPARPPSPSS